ncbi:hypothetical protein [Streptomyces sp. NPDC053560]|uniref:hypothetical protein n=1 Tax=Streptomyces sp. NPDC053560 TaxID=3365711 RepID=UPI0037CD059C
MGRIVHYVSHGTPPREDGSQAYQSQDRAAIITTVHGTVEPGPDDPAGTPMWEVGLAVLNPEGLFFNQRVVQDETGTGPGTWHWPVRVMS